MRLRACCSNMLAFLCCLCLPQCDSTHVNMRLQFSSAFIVWSWAYFLRLVLRYMVLSLSLLFVPCFAKRLLAVVGTDFVESIAIVASLRSLDSSFEA